MKPLDKKERAELKKLTRKIQTQKATMREVNRAIDLTNRDHAAVKAADLVKVNGSDSSYTNDQLQKLEDAAYKVAEAQSLFADVVNEMSINSQWRGRDEVQRAHNDLRELTSEGSLEWMLRCL